MRYKLLLIKRLLEDICMYPLILFGRFLARVKPLPKEYDTFYFFPFYHTGGAEKVHALIAKATGSENCIIYFTRKSHNKGFLELFEDSGCTIKDISNFTDNKWLYFNNIIFRGIISGYINSQQNLPLIFNGQCNFGYKISPWIHRNSSQIELIHSVSNFSYIRIPFLPFISRTIMISTIKIAEHLEIYKRYSIPMKMAEKIKFIMNGIILPTTKALQKEKVEHLNVLYVGRSTPEKRVHLIAQIAYLIGRKESRIKFHFLGEVKDAIPDEYRQFCHFWGNQKDESIIGDIYNKAHLLILLSNTEGFPMVIMEAMARGLAIVATSVGELPLHIKNGVNGFLIDEFKNENTVIEESIGHISRLFNDSDLLHSISRHNIDYAYQHFGISRFENEYRQLFEEMKYPRLTT